MTIYATASECRTSEGQTANLKLKAKKASLDFPMHIFTSRNPTQHSAHRQYYTRFKARSLLTCPALLTGLRPNLTSGPVPLASAPFRLAPSTGCESLEEVKNIGSALQAAWGIFGHASQHEVPSAGLVRSPDLPQRPLIGGERFPSAL